MMISTKGRYALDVMLDLAVYGADERVSVKDISARCGISVKYLEAIIAMLAKAGLVDSFRGKGGGYSLNRELSEYTVGEIVKLTEGDIAPVSCLENGASGCERKDKCLTISMWMKLDKLIDEYLESVTLADLVGGSVKP